MQPHSTCAIALANNIYNHQLMNGEPVGKKGRIRVRYQSKKNEHKNIIYDFDDLRSLGENFEDGFSVWVKRSGDPLSCTLTVHKQKGKYEPGKHFHITHSTQHKAGLEEHFDLYRNKISSGQHRNSERYGRFASEFVTDRQIKVESYLIKTQSHELQDVVREVVIESI